MYLYYVLCMICMLSKHTLVYAPEFQELTTPISKEQPVRDLMKQKEAEEKQHAKVLAQAQKQYAKVFKQMFEYDNKIQAQQLKVKQNPSESNKSKLEQTKQEQRNIKAQLDELQASITKSGAERSTAAIREKISKNMKKTIQNTAQLRKQVSEYSDDITHATGSERTAKLSEFSSYVSKIAQLFSRKNLTEFVEILRSTFPNIKELQKSFHDTMQRLQRKINNILNIQKDIDEKRTDNAQKLTLAQQATTSKDESIAALARNMVQALENQQALLEQRKNIINTQLEEAQAESKALSDVSAELMTQPSATKPQPPATSKPLPPIGKKPALSGEAQTFEESLLSSGSEPENVDQ